MDKLETVKKQIGKEFRVLPHEIKNFNQNGECRLNFKEKDVLWQVYVKLIDKKTMKITDIKRESIVKVS